eukprot:scaffold36364_cov133-Skeletonema_dohrnii-CCMP3373.AAC.2
MEWGDGICILPVEYDGCGHSKRVVGFKFTIRVSFCDGIRKAVKARTLTLSCTTRRRRCEFEIEELNPQNLVGRLIHQQSSCCARNGHFCTYNRKRTRLVYLMTLGNICLGLGMRLSMKKDNTCGIHSPTPTQTSCSFVSTY